MTTTTVPHDPAKEAARQQWLDTPVESDALALDGKLLDACQHAKWKTIGDIWTATLNGDAMDRIKPQIPKKDDRDDLLIALEEYRGVIEEEASKPAPKIAIAPSRDEKGYERKFECKINRVGIGKTTFSAGIKIEVSGEDGHAGYARSLIERYFIESQVDIKIAPKEPEQMEINPDGRKPFFAVGLTKRVSGGGKDASFSLTIPRSGNNFIDLTMYAEDEAMLHVNLVGEKAKEDTDEAQAQAA